MRQLTAVMVLTFLACVLGGCSSTGLKKVFHDNFADYTPESSIPPLKLPPDVTLPEKDSYYDIPHLAASTEAPHVSLYPPGSRLMNETMNESPTPQ